MRGARHQQMLLVAATLLALGVTAAVAQLDVKLNLANDPRFNKMLPEQNRTVAATTESPVDSKTVRATVSDLKLNDIEHSEIGKHDLNEAYSEYNYEDEYEDEDEEVTKKGDKKQVIVKNAWKLKPIKGNDQNTLEDEKPHSSSSTAKPIKAAASNPINMHDDTIDDVNDDDDGAAEDDDAADDDMDLGDDDEYSDDIEDAIAVDTTTTSASTQRKTSAKLSVVSAEPIADNQNGCPMNCVCELNLNGYMVANCDRLDAETMHFGESITDLEVINVPPKYPLLLGADFFKRIGLQHVSSIKIVDTTIENIHPDAFRGLDQLFSVNLTNTGLDMLPPDAFAHNTKLRILSLSGNDLHAMQQKSSPFVDYMLNAPTVEELYLSRCNIRELLPTAFSKLSSVVFISLAENMLVTLPHNILHKLPTLEELDLSSNSIENLPRHIFDNTSLSILNLRYNELSARPTFVSAELQKLDLSYNKLVNINDMMFTDLPNLNDLGLKGNRIRKVHHAAFAPLTDLRHIDLSFNDLEQVSAMMFHSNVYLDTIRLNDNAHLKKLPMDGFSSQKSTFNVYLFDVSNCDLTDLGDKTFESMPRLTVLNLSWNNIESLSSGLFSYLSKLAKLDLSNNLINGLSDMLLLHNRFLRKLNLAGNPLEKLSSKVFLPTKQLTELDVSDCNLKSVWTETDVALHPKNLLKNLKTLNVSNNEIVHIRTAELAVLERLAVFDLSNNNLSCDKDFRDLMKWLEKKKIASGQLRAFMRESADPAVSLADMDSHSPWEEYSLMRCSKKSAAVVSKVVVSSPADKNNETDEHDDDDGPVDDAAIVDSINGGGGVEEHVASPHGVQDQHLGEPIDYNDDDDDEYDEDDEDDEENDDDDDGGIDNGEKEIKLSADHPVKVVESEPKKTTATVVDSNERTTGDDADDDDDEYSDEDGDDDDGDDDTDTNDDDHFEVLRQTYVQYGYLLPIVMIMLAVITILMSVAKIVSVMMRRRGERYHQALLASKNSIVYQKLSEEIGAPTTPKFHRYAPIQQV